jgi:two-component system sensor histidine kinase YesM
MKQKWRFLSERVAWVIGLLLGLGAVLLLALAVSCLYLHRMLFFLLPAAVLYILLIVLIRKELKRPFQETEKMMELFTEGYTLQGVSSQDHPASPATEAAFDKLQELLSTNDMIHATKRQAQYIALQNQINPHFLYNTLEGIRGEAIAAGLNTVAKMTEALATFFRYTISNLENLVTLEDELGNIENYFLIQQYRFGERLQMQVVYEEEDYAGLIRCRIPKLTLQPIVENSIVHGVERKMGRGNLRIKLEGTEKRLIITVSDNGVGMGKEVLAELNRQLATKRFQHVNGDNSQEGGIALVNVNNRIQLLFGEQYGLCVYSTPGVGTDVEITLPRTTRSVKVTG